MDAGSPHFLGKEGSSWTVTKKKKMGVIIILDPDNKDKLIVSSNRKVQYSLGDIVAALKLDGLGPLDNRPSTNKLHHFVRRKKK